MYSCSALIGSSTIIRHVQHLILKVGDSDLPVLITGDPGTKKDEIAKIIFEKSSRKEGPFVPISARKEKSEEIFNSIFFQYSNSDQGKSGLELAKDGFLYIEEISKLDEKAQDFLIKYLNKEEITLNGKTIQSNARVICSSTCNLEQLIRNGQFKEDLFYRLSSSSIYIPPLRERREDIPILAQHFLDRANKLRKRNLTSISHDALNALLQNPWTNNIQELENLIDRISVLKSSGQIEICDLPPKLRALVTDNIDDFYAKAIASAQAKNQYSDYQGSYNSNTQNPTYDYQNYTVNQKYYNNANSKSIPQMPHEPYNSSLNSQNDPVFGNHRYSKTQKTLHHNPTNIDESPSDIDHFIKKDIDLGAGIDFYKIVEEFENKLIAEALRRTNHNKNRAAQLLSMNRTTLVEKLKKRASNNSMKASDSNRVKKNSAFTIFDSLGKSNKPFESLDFATLKNSADNVSS